MALHIKAEANRCLLCKKPLCQEGCPIHTPIPTVIQLFKENKLMEAGEMLFNNNPMSVVCSIVCDHGNQCMGHCIQGKKGNPIQFYEIEKFISDAYLDRMDTTTPAEKKEAVAVIGSGPAGMTVAIILAKAGYRVTIFEERNMVGGMLRYGIPDYRLPNSLLDRFRDKLLEMGVQIRTHVVLGGDLFMEDLFRDGYASVFIGTGAWRPARLGIQGESLANVHFGISYLANPGAHDLGKLSAAVPAVPATTNANTQNWTAQKSSTKKVSSASHRRDRFSSIRCWTRTTPSSAMKIRKNSSKLTARLLP